MNLLGERKVFRDGSSLVEAETVTANPAATLSGSIHFRFRMTGGALRDRRLMASTTSWSTRMCIEADSRDHPRSGDRGPARLQASRIIRRTTLASA